MRKYNRLFLIFGIIMGVSELWKQLCLTYIVNGGNYDWWHFPFQLCSIPMYVCLLLPWVKHVPLRRTLLTFLMDFSLLSGVFTFFDTSGLHYSYAPLTLHSFVWHILLIVLGLMAGICGGAGYTWKSYRQSVCLYAGCCAAATILNLTLYRFGPINMFYISPHYRMEQLLFGSIAEQLGNHAGILIYLCAIPAGAGMVHAIWRSILKKRFSLSTQ